MDQVKWVVIDLVLILLLELKEMYVISIDITKNSLHALFSFINK